MPLEGEYLSAVTEQSLSSTTMKVEQEEALTEPQKKESGAVANYEVTEV